MKRLFKRRAPKAALALVLAVALALSCGAVAVAAGGAGGSGDEGGLSSLLSIKLKRGAFDVPGDDGVLADAEASLDAGRSQQAAGPTTLAIKLKSVPYHTVTFVEYWVDDTGAIEQEDGAARAHTYTQQAADSHTTSPRDEAPEDRWLDGWFRADPADAGTTDASQLGERVDFANERITADVTFYGMLKTGFTLYLDGNATDAKVADPGYVSLARDVDYEAGKTPDQMDREGVEFGDATPKAVRAGWDFKGWYWPELTSDGKTQVDTVNGGVLLAARDGDPALGLDGSGNPTSLTYGQMLKHRGQTLYAKWEVAKPVRIKLAGAKGPQNAAHDDSVYLWFWPGRGYTSADPTMDAALAEKKLVASADTSVDVAALQLPWPQYATQYFAGWGVPSADPADDGDYLVVCDKSGDTYSYKLAARAFADDYVTQVDGVLSWAGGGVDEGEGYLETTWDVVYKTAQISVRAPFEVTFKERAQDAESDPNALSGMQIDELDDIYKEPFTMDGLSGKTFVESPQEFVNTSTERDVYISKVECVNVGAGALLPGGAAGEAIFSLAERPQGALGSFPRGGTTVNFGYAGASAEVDVDRGKPGSWIVLPRTDPATKAETPRVLWYGLDVASADFDRTKVAFGAGSGANGAAGSEGAGQAYIAKIANVKYTYSVVP